jgi:superfamily II DNA/RNA helicase
VTQALAAQRATNPASPLPTRLQDPEYVSVHAEAAAPTPLRLQQAYMVCDLQQKVDILWSFIKTHLKASGGGCWALPGG